jgi:hypothetical protein
MTELRTDPSLLAALSKATTRSLTAKEVHDQQVSFIMSSLNQSSGVTRQRVDEVLAERDGRPAG